ncbi:MAG: hypothetical protein LBJ59_05695 [Zoogloeaceae bacterium]|jgi:hypothetical protein|nr:hypothetical protein [Zoogloeaceae bacterium]
MCKKSFSLLVLVGAGLLSACVTINIYFPAAAAEKMADRLIDDIWQLDEPAEPKKDKESEVTP